MALKHQKRTVILATHKEEFLSKSDYVIFIESGTIKNQGTLEQLEKDKVFFYHRTVIKEKELNERLCLKPGTCKTTNERQQLARFVLKKQEFRGPKKRKKQMNLYPLGQKKIFRQVSCDTTNTLPCYEWNECGNCVDNVHDLEPVFLPSLNEKNAPHADEKPRVKRIFSMDPNLSLKRLLKPTNSFNLQMILNKDSNHLPVNLFQQEENDDNDELDNLFSLIHQNELATDEEDNYDDYEDDVTDKINNEMLQEIINYKEVILFYNVIKLN